MIRSESPESDIAATCRIRTGSFRLIHIGEYAVNQELAN